tara:strand:- start:300 stop:1442 length:1143 start_codon:yes stop_codon:yes gene_type:complete
MATVTKTIGTSSRDYSDINSWEADLSDDSIYADTNDAVGVMYADATFTNATVTIDGGISIGTSSGQDLASITLTVVAADRHDGTAASGALLKPTANSGHNQGIIRVNRDNVTIEWLDIDMDNDDDLTTADTRNTNKGIVLVEDNNNNIIRNNIIRDKYGDPGGTGPQGISHIGTGASSDSLYIFNNIIYNLIETSNDSAAGVLVHSWAGNLYIYNNTVYNIQGAGGSKHGIGFRFGNTASCNTRIKNNIASKCEGGNDRAYWQSASGSTVDSANNLSDDTTHATYDAEDMGQSLNDSSALIGKTLAEIGFVSTTVGSEDLHIGTALSVCNMAGVDLGTTNGVDIDINGRDRDALGDAWTIGAHQFTAIAENGSAFLLFLD